MSGGIYLIRNAVSGREYVGSSANMRRRFVHHRNRLRAGAHHGPRLQRAWNLRGEAAFEFVVLELVADPADLVAREQWHMDARRPAYNTARAAGSVLGIKRSPDTRARIAAALLGNQYGRGHRKTEEWKAAAAARMTGNTHSLGKKLPASFSAALSARNAGNTYGTAHKGVPKSEAHRVACSHGQRRRWARARGEQV